MRFPAPTVLGGTVPTERSHLRPNRFPEPSTYRQDRAVAERAHQLASRVGLRQAAIELGVSRDTLKNAWAGGTCPSPSASRPARPAVLVLTRFPGHFESGQEGPQEVRDGCT
jgi:hypothetical protein